MWTYGLYPRQTSGARPPPRPGRPSLRVGALCSSPSAVDSAGFCRPGRRFPPSPPVTDRRRRGPRCRLQLAWPPRNRRGRRRRSEPGCGAWQRARRRAIAVPTVPPPKRRKSRFVRPFENQRPRLFRGRGGRFGAEIRERSRPGSRAPATRPARAVRMREPLQAEMDERPQQPAGSISRAAATARRVDFAEAEPPRRLGQPESGPAPVGRPDTRRLARSAGPTFPCDTNKLLALL